MDVACGANTSRYRLAQALAFAVLLTLVLGCAEGAYYRAAARSTEGLNWLVTQPDVYVCIQSQSDLGDSDYLRWRVRYPVRSEDLEVRTSKCQSQAAQRFSPELWLSSPPRDVNRLFASALNASWMEVARASQWVGHQTAGTSCYLNGETRGDEVVELFGGRSFNPRFPVLLQSCGWAVLAIHRAQIPPGTPACGAAPVPTCGSAK